MCLCSTFVSRSNIKVENTRLLLVFFANINRAKIYFFIPLYLGKSVIVGWCVESQKQQCSLSEKSITHHVVLLHK